MMSSQEAADRIDMAHPELVHMAIGAILWSLVIRVQSTTMRELIRQGEPTISEIMLLIELGDIFLNEHKCN